MQLRAAPFTVGLAAQRAFFLHQGYVLIKGCVPEASARLLKVVQHDASALLEKNEKTWGYWWWRLRNSVNDNFKRHSFALPVTTSLQALLNHSVNHLAPLLLSQEAGLALSSPLVELSCIFSQPGSHDQHRHSDVKSCQPKIISVFIALEDVVLESGPTLLFAGSQTSLFHQRHPTSPTSFEYNADGSQDAVSPSPSPSLASPGEKAVEGEMSADEAADSAPVLALLKAGDVLVLNTRLFHNGTRNTTTRSRDLICVSFQPRDEHGLAPRVEGFTHHLHQDVRLELGDFVMTRAGEGVKGEKNHFD